MSAQVTFQQHPWAGLSEDEALIEADEALAALEDIDARYERDRDELSKWVGPERAKERLLARLQARRKADRGPIVTRLLQLRGSVRQVTALA